MTFRDLGVQTWREWLLSCLLPQPYEERQQKSACTKKNRHYMCQYVYHAMY